MQDAGEIGASTGAVFFIFGAAGHICPFPAIGTKRPWHAGQFGGAAWDIRLQRSKGVWCDVVVAVEDQAAGLCRDAEFCFNRGMVALAVSSREGDDRAVSGTAGGFGQIGGEAEIGGCADGEDEVSAAIGQVYTGALPFHDPAAGYLSKEARRLAGDGAVAIRADQAGPREKGMGVEKATTLAAADIENDLRVGFQMGNQVVQKKMIHHRARLFSGQFGKGAEVGRKGQVSAVEEAFPRNWREAVQHLIGGKVKKVEGKPTERRACGMTKADKIGHEGAPARISNLYALWQNIEPGRMQGAAACG